MSVSSPPRSGGDMVTSKGGIGHTGTPSRITSNPLDIDGSNFDSEAYLSKLMKEKSLLELMDVEHDMVQQVRQLDSEMQTLVYENYAKFITATDTIREMRADFAKMENEMDILAQNMDRITEFSEKVCGSLQGRKENIQALVKTSKTLKSFEYILDLPAQMSSFLEQKNFEAAVSAYEETLPVLENHKQTPAFQGIHAECMILLDELRSQLNDEFRGKITSAKELTAVVGYLVRLGDDPRDLSQQYLILAKEHLSKDLKELEEQVELSSGNAGQWDRAQTSPLTSHKMSGKVRPADSIPSLPMDILEFMDSGSNTFLSNASLIITAYLDLFAKEAAPQGTPSSSVPLTQAAEFITPLMREYLACVWRRLEREQADEDCSLLVRALDRLYRRLLATSKVIPSLPNILEEAMSVILKAGKLQVDLSLSKLKRQFKTLLGDVRSQLAAPKSFLQAGERSSTNQPLAELLSRFEQGIVQWIKTALANLLQFTAYDVNFAGRNEFLAPYGFYVREHLVGDFFRHIIKMSTEFSQGIGEKAFVTPGVVLLLSRLCLNLESSTIGYLLDLSEQQFRVNLTSGGGSSTGPNAQSSYTNSCALCEEMRKTAQKLIDHFVEMEGFTLSQMLSKSVETRDWVGCVEPRAVRAVMKRVVEDLTTVDSRVGQLYEEGVRKDRSSDSSRLTGGHQSIVSRPAQRGQWNISTSSAENPLLRKLWSEKIDYFASVEFSRVSVVTGVIKICLKTLLECVRLRTFGKYGFQQVQVDAYYLQLYLWRFVSDENLVYHLLEEITTSATLRCLDPVLMEPSVVEMICERG